MALPVTQAAEEDAAEATAAEATADQATAADDLEDLEIDLLLTAIARRFGYDFRRYAPASLRRRIRHIVHAEGAPNITSLQARILHERGTLERFVSGLAVHTTRMFRDPPFYEALRSSVVPLLRTYPFARIWHAGCSTGEEVYSLAILLHEEGIYDRCRIYATDLSDALLDVARRGIYSVKSISERAEAYRAAGGTRELSAYYLADDYNAIFAQELRRNVVFSQHNLAVDGSFNEFHVILCRNVMLYFNEDLRAHVHQLFYDSLSSFGVLGLGSKETIRFTPLADRYVAMSPPVSLYRRIR
jgi:chemotaxis protein methyltransferase CheR